MRIDFEPLPQGAPCNGKTSHVSYLLAADPDDPLGDFAADHPEDMESPYNDGDYYLYLMVVPTNTNPEEDANPRFRRRTQAEGGGNGNSNAAQQQSAPATEKGKPDPAAFGQEPEAIE